MPTCERVMPYIVERELGEGSMASVYIARHTVFNTRSRLRRYDLFPSFREEFIQETDIQIAYTIQQHAGASYGFRERATVITMKW